MSLTRPTWLLIALGAVVAAALAAGTAAASSKAPRALAQAEQAARDAVAPAAVKAVRCLDAPGGADRGRRSRLLCTVTHPSPAGQTCRPFVLVAPRGRAQVYLAAVCLPSRSEVIRP